MKEEWMFIKYPEFENDYSYKISNTGKVISFKYDKNGKELGQYMTGKGYEKGNGYMTVCLYIPNSTVSRNYKVHRLVADHFIPNPNNLPQVNHKDGNKTNNNVDNLEWCNNSYNQKHAFSMGLNYTTDKVLEKASENIIVAKTKIKKPVVKFDKNYNVLDYYSSLSEAVDKNKGVSVIKHCNYECVGGEFKWRYMNECKLRQKLIIISGKSASGKTTIVKELCNQGFNNNILSFTTRDKRTGEADGIDYEFIKKENLIGTTDILNIKLYNTEYGVLFYGFKINELKKENPIVILDYEGMKEIQDKIGKHNVITVFIDSDYNIRYKRAFEREYITDNVKNEINRRFRADEEDFSKERILEYDYILKNNTMEDFDKCIEFIKQINLNNKPQKTIPLKFHKREFFYNEEYFCEYKDICNKYSINYKTMDYRQRKNKTDFLLEIEKELNKNNSTYIPILKLNS